MRRSYLDLWCYMDMDLHAGGTETATFRLAQWPTEWSHLDLNLD